MVGDDSARWPNSILASGVAQEFSSFLSGTMNYVSSAVAWNKMMKLCQLVEKRSVKHAVRYDDF